MTDTAILTSSEIGMLRIYMAPRDTAEPRKAWKLWSARPLYRELVVQAKAAGLMNAVAHHTHYGFSNHGPVLDQGAETSNPYLTMCVELIGHRADLELFCQRHAALLETKVVIYKQLEHWSIEAPARPHPESKA